MKKSNKRKPFFCNYWLTYKCNSKCNYCNFWQDNSLKKFSNAKYENVKNNLNDLKKMGVKFIDFTGGEPLLNNNLPEILSSAKQLGFFVKLSTNGILYPQKAEELKGLASRTYFSLDTIDNEEYKQIRGADELDNVKKGIEIAKNNDEDVCLLYTVTDENIKNLDDIVNFAKENKTMVFIHPCFSYFNNKALSSDNTNKIKKYFWKSYVRMSLPQLDFHKRGGNNLLKPRCKSGFSTIDIGPDDTLIVPCAHKYKKRVPINGELYSLFKSKKWDELYSQIGRYDFCNNCTIDCYFGMSYFDRLGKYFVKQNLTYLKNIIEFRRAKQ